MAEEPKYDEATQAALQAACDQARIDLPYCEVLQARPFHYHFHSARWYIEVDVAHWNREEGNAIVLYRVWRLPDGHVAAFKVDIRESEA
jgi:hypothetical protein